MKKQTSLTAIKIDGMTEMNKMKDDCTVSLF